MPKRAPGAPPLKWKSVTLPSGKNVRYFSNYVQNGGSGGWLDGACAALTWLTDAQMPRFTWSSVAAKIRMIDSASSTTVTRSETKNFTKEIQVSRMTQRAGWID